jgi:hypothetical protein
LRVTFSRAAATASGSLSRASTSVALKAEPRGLMMASAEPHRGLDDDAQRGPPEGCPHDRREAGPHDRREAGPHDRREAHDRSGVGPFHARGGSGSNDGRVSGLLDSGAVGRVVAGRGPRRRDDDSARAHGTERRLHLERPALVRHVHRRHVRTRTQSRRKPRNRRVARSGVGEEHPPVAVVVRLDGGRVAAVERLGEEVRKLRRRAWTSIHVERRPQSSALGGISQRCP